VSQKTDFTAADVNNNETHRDNVDKCNAWMLFAAGVV